MSNAESFILGWLADVYSILVNQPNTKGLCPHKGKLALLVVPTLDLVPPFSPKL